MTPYRTARNRSEIPTLDGNYSIFAGRVYLPVPAWQTQEAIPAGAIQGQRGGHPGTAGGFAPVAAFGITFRQLRANELAANHHHKHS
jgi:hypothetical protein